MRGKGLNFNFMVSSTSIDPYDPKGSDRIQTRLRPVTCDKANWFTDCWVVEEGVRYSFESLKSIVSTVRLEDTLKVRVF